MLYVFSGHLALLVNHVIQKETYVKLCTYSRFIVKTLYVFSGHLALFYVTYMQHICYFTWGNCCGSLVV